MADFEYRFRDDDFSADEKLLKDGLNRYAKETADLTRDFAGVFCYQGNKIIGGVTAQVTGSTLSVKLLWVVDGHRGKSVGRRLMAELERGAKDKGCKTAFVDTMSYQAPEFYPKLGYAEVARIADFYEGHDRVFYRKDLS